MPLRFRFKKGDRVDFAKSPDEGQGTPGVIRFRSHKSTRPRYAVDWIDGNTDQDLFDESELTPFVLPRETMFRDSRGWANLVKSYDGTRQFSVTLVQSFSPDGEPLVAFVPVTNMTPHQVAGMGFDRESVVAHLSLSAFRNHPGHFGLILDTSAPVVMNVTGTDKVRIQQWIDKLIPR